MTQADLELILICVAVGIGAGYLLMRFTVRRILSLAKANEQALRDIIGPDRISDINKDSNEVTALAKTFTEIISKLENNIKKLELAKGTLQNVLFRVGHGISSFQDIDSFLGLIVETITCAVGGKAGILLLLNEKRTHLEVRAIYGEMPIFAKGAAVEFGKNIFDEVILSKQDLVVSKASEPIFVNFVHAGGMEPPLMATPLLLHEKALGVLVISGRKADIDFGEEEMALLRSVAMQTAVAIENDQLNLDAEKNYFAIISALALAVEAKDPYSRGHQDRVADYAVKIAEKLKLNDEEKDALRDAGKLHDLGKIGISDDILSKPGPLTDEEWGIMRTHPAVGEEILKPIKSLEHLRDLVRHHHEKLDGTGYPDGLKGNQVSLLARILAVADIYDALRTTRPYRKALSKEESTELLQEMDNKIDQSIVKALLATV